MEAQILCKSSILELVKIYWRRKLHLCKRLFFCFKIKVVTLVGCFRLILEVGEIWEIYGKSTQLNCCSYEHQKQTSVLFIKQCSIVERGAPIYIINQLINDQRKKCIFPPESAFHPCNCADMAKTGSLTGLLASIWAHNLAGWTSSNI